MHDWAKIHRFYNCTVFQLEGAEVIVHGADDNWIVTLSKSTVFVYPWRMTFSSRETAEENAVRLLQGYVAWGEWGAEPD